MRKRTISMAFSALAAMVLLSFSCFSADIHFPEKTESFLLPLYFLFVSGLFAVIFLILSGLKMKRENRSLKEKIAVTERSNTDKMLERLFEDTTVGLFIAVKKEDTFVYTHVNKTLSEIYYPEASLPGRTVEDVFGQEDGHTRAEVYRQVVKQGKNLNYDIDKGNLILNTSVFPYYENGNCIGVYGSVVDITEAAMIKRDIMYIINCTGIFVWEFDTRTQNFVVRYRSMEQQRKNTFKSMNLEHMIERLVYPEDRRMVENKTLRFLNGEISEYKLECRICVKPGQYHWIRCFGFALIKEGDRVISMKGVCININDQKEISDKFEKNEERLRMVLNNTSDMIVQINSQRDIVYVSPSFCRMTGKKEEEWIGGNFLSCIHPDDLGLVYNRQENKYEFHKTDILRFLTLYGYKWVEWHANRKYEQDKSVTVTLSGHDVNERELTRIGMEYTLSHDSLTGLYTRLKLEELICMAIRDEEDLKAAGIYFNIDNFKMINELFGQEGGDECLKLVAAILAENAPEGSIAARLSDDKFYLFVRKYKSREFVLGLVSELMEKIKDAPKRGSVMRDDEVNVNAGITFFPQDAQTCTDLIFFSEYAALVAKSKGKRQFEVFRREYAQESRHKYEMLKDLCQGIENGEFEMYFQPIVDIRDGCVDKLEALVRWNHPQKGFLNPASFIEIAEESREIIPLGEYVFGRIIESMALFKGTKYERIPVSFNVSPIQLELQGFADHLTGIIRKNQIDSAGLYIEITEATILSQAPAVKENLRKLREAGFRIAIDDFGIQYSSLSYLERLDYDVLKIDSHFVQNIHKGKTSQMIFKFIKKLADEFGKECIVEGVETKEQLEQVFKIGFYKIQGFYYARPMEVRELLRYELPKYARTADRQG